MKVRGLYLGVLFFFVLALGVNFTAGAQVPTTGTLRGQVTDPSGSTVSGAAVLLTAPNGNSVDSVTNKDGFYEVTGLAPGTYSVKVVAEGFGLFTASNIAVKAGTSPNAEDCLGAGRAKIGNTCRGRSDATGCEPGKQRRRHYFERQRSGSAVGRSGRIAGRAPSAGGAVRGA